jgi:hypothetical protein
MSEKQVIWLCLSLVLVTYNPLNIFNGLDLLGFIMLSYTVYRIVEDNLNKFRNSNKWQTR